MTSIQQALLQVLAGQRALLVFAAANLLFLLADVGLAHSAYFHSPFEYVPLAVSAFGGTLAFILAWLSVEKGTVRAGLILVAAASIATGVWGLFLHLGSEILVRPTLHRLVYSAPTVAPLAYAGLGLLILAAVFVPSPIARGRCVEGLAGLGLLGNFLLCLLDHAQNGFWAPAEWLSVAAGAVGGVALIGRALTREDRSSERYFVWGVLAAMVAISVLGTTLHLAADLRPRNVSVLDRFRYGAPIFAPMLFADLAALGALGVLARRPETSH